MNSFKNFIKPILRIFQPKKVIVEPKEYIPEAHHAERKVGKTAPWWWKLGFKSKYEIPRDQWQLRCFGNFQPIKRFRYVRGSATRPKFYPANQQKALVNGISK